MPDNNGGVLSVPAGYGEHCQPEAQRLNAHQVDFLRKQPARIIFAKACRLHQRRGFKFRCGNIIWSLGGGNMDDLS